MGTEVTCPNGRKFGVRNVSYVLQRWQEVECFSVSESGQPFINCWLQVHFASGRIYETYFPTLSVVADFLQRPEFFERPVIWFGNPVAVRQLGRSTPPIVRTNCHRN
jgi:hypothetical protein